jgi:hypothetical protein
LVPIWRHNTAMVIREKIDRDYAELNGEAGESGNA